MIDKMWVGEENLKMMPGHLVWTSWWIVISFNKIKNTEVGAGLRVQNNEYCLGQAELKVSVDYQSDVQWAVGYMF